jgi:hypothetical protein
VEPVADRGAPGLMPAKNYPRPLTWSEVPTAVGMEPVRREK